MQVIEEVESVQAPEAPAPLVGLRNIHVAAPAEQADRSDLSDPADSSPLNLHCRRVKRSPNEHFAAKVAEHGKPLEFPQSVIALVLQKQRSVEVTKNGLHFDYLKTKYTFWHPHSPTCANKIGLKMLVTFDPDDMSFIHVLTPDGRYVESIPQKNRVEWFDDVAMREAQKEKKAALSRDIERFREIHGPTTEQKARRVVSNAEKMQIVNTFPTESAPDTRNLTPDPCFSKADEIHAAMAVLRQQKTARADRKIAMRGFKPADLVGDPAAERRTLQGEGETEAWEAGTGSRARPRFRVEALLET